MSLKKNDVQKLGTFSLAVNLVPHKFESCFLGDLAFDQLQLTETVTTQAAGVIRRPQVAGRGSKVIGGRS